MVPRTRSRPRVSRSPRLVVPAKTTNAAITAQYQREGENSSPPMMARLVATPTCTACRVVVSARRVGGGGAWLDRSGVLGASVGCSASAGRVGGRPLPRRRWWVGGLVGAWCAGRAGLADVRGRRRPCFGPPRALRPGVTPRTRRAARRRRALRPWRPTARRARWAASSSAGARVGEPPVAVAAPRHRRPASSGRRSSSAGRSTARRQGGGLCRREALGGQLRVEDVDLQVALLLLVRPTRAAISSSAVSLSRRPSRPTSRRACSRSSSSASSSSATAKLRAWTRARNARTRRASGVLRLLDEAGSRARAARSRCR